TTVRTYSVEGTLADIPQLAARHNINVALGAWIDDHRDSNEKELARTIEVARTHPNVMRVFIGNEVVLRGELTSEEMGKYLDRARDSIGQPVSTAEPWHVWLAHPDLVDHVDFIGVHLLPSWEGVSVGAAPHYSFAQFHRLQKPFPGKPIVIAEIGWPSHSRTRDTAESTRAHDGLVARHILLR